MPDSFPSRERDAADRTEPSAFGKDELPSRLFWWAGCAVAFVVLYGATSRLSLSRAMFEAPRLPFERGLPVFTDAVIVYGSVFPASLFVFFLDARPEQVRRLTQAFLASLAVATAIFLLAPSRCTPSELVVGSQASGEALAALRTLDTPANAFPSLHLVASTLIALHLSRHTRFRRAPWAWWLAVWASTVLAGQHTVLDGAAGAGLALLADSLVARGGRSFIRPSSS